MTQRKYDYIDIEQESRGLDAREWSMDQDQATREKSHTRDKPGLEKPLPPAAD